MTAYCNQCGVSLPSDARFCEECGIQIDKYQSSSKKKKTPGLKLLLVLLLGSGALLLASQYGKDIANLKEAIRQKSPVEARKELVQLGISVDESGLERSIKAGDLYALELFFTIGISPNTKVGFFLTGQSPLIFLAINEKREPVIRLLLDKGADVNARDKEMATPLIRATQHSLVHIMRLFIDRGADVNAMDSEKNTPLMKAVGHGNKTAVDLLLQNGAEVDSKTARGATALMIASYEGNIEFIETLLEKGANINARDDLGQTPLHYAIFGASNRFSLNTHYYWLEFARQKNSKPSFEILRTQALQTMDLLIERGSDINARMSDRLRRSPLDEANACIENKKNVRISLKDEQEYSLCVDLKKKIIQTGPKG